VLPEGLYYGRVDHDDLDPLLDSYFDGRIHLDRYRGRSIHTFVVQAAERALREETGLTGIADVAVEGVVRRGEGWRVSLRAGGVLRDVDVESELAEEAVYLTCDSVTPQRPRRFSARVR
jgi:8-oxo-dGTP pyrophosphatase MutT (NUDIX family)